MFKRFYQGLGMVLLGAVLFSPLTVHAAETLSPPKMPSKAEIIQKWNELDQNRYTTPTPFEEEPSIQAPYKTGSVNKAYIEQGVKTANFYRYLSGLPMNLTATDQLNELSQYGAVLTAKNGYLDHNPSQPADMPKDFYNQAYYSTSTSNLAMFGFRPDRNLLSNTVDMYMNDSDAYNIDRVGHRMWVLSPYVSSVGFGLAKDERNFAYSAMNVFGNGQAQFSSSPSSYFAYPGTGNVPKEYFNPDYAWSVLLDSRKIIPGDLEGLKVTLTRKSDGKKWDFAYGSNQPVTGNYFSVSYGYGSLTALIFRPADLDYIQDGEEFTVNVTGFKDLYDKEYVINYKTTFFDLVKDRAFGKLVNEKTGEPLSGVTVEIDKITESGQSLYKSMTTDANGEFDYTGIPIGDYFISFAKKGYGSVSMGLEIADDRERFDHDLGEIDMWPYDDTTPPSVPHVNVVTDQSTTVTGNAEGDSTITVKVGASVIGEATADPYGNFSMSIPKQSAGTTLLVTATDAFGNVSDAATAVVQDGTPPAKPVLNDVNDRDAFVTGTAEAGSKVEVKVDGAVIGSAVAGSDSKFMVDIPVQAAGVKLMVTATDKFGNSSEGAVVMVSPNGNETGKLSGWVWSNGSWYFYDQTTGNKKTGWFLEESTWYYFDRTGAMKTGWFLDGSTWYFFKNSGAMQTGWLLDGSTWYYFNGSGAMKTGWMLNGSTWYFFNNSGAMKTGWQQSGSTWYYFKSSGAMKTGWLLSGTTWYYFKSSGAMQTGWAQISGKRYYFNQSGAMK